MKQMDKKAQMFGHIPFWLGIAIILVSHLMILSGGLPPEKVMIHAVVNLIAVVVVVIAEVFNL